MPTCCIPEIIIKGFNVSGFQGFRVVATPGVAKVERRASRLSVHLIIEAKLDLGTEQLWGRFFSSIPFIQHHAKRTLNLETLKLWNLETPFPFISLPQWKTGNLTLNGFVCSTL
jgi:hypothetical protein